MNLEVDKLHITESISRLGGVETLVKQFVSADEGSYAVALLDTPTKEIERAMGLRVGKYAGASMIRRLARAHFANARTLVFHNFAGLMMLSGVIPHQRKCLFLHTNSNDVFSLLKSRLSYLDAIIVSGHDLEAEIHDRFPSLRVPVSAVEYPLDSRYFEKWERLPRTRLLIGYSGRLGIEQKQVLRLIEFCRNLLHLGVEFELEIAGTGTAQQELQRQLPPTHCRFLGALEPVSLHEAYKRWDFLICTSDYETGPLVAMEAMATGSIPILPSIPCQATEMIADLNIPMYSTGNMLDAARLIQRLAIADNLPELRQRVIAKVADRHIDGFIGQINAVLDEAANRPAIGLTPAVPQGIAEFLPFKFRKFDDSFLR